MGILIAGRNMSSFAYESGTYAVPSGTAQWIGHVQSFDPDDTENIQRIRYHGTNTRNVDKSVEGARDRGGSFEYYPQDFKFLMFALGSIGDLTTGSPTFYTHNIKELESNEANSMTSGTRNPFTSFTFESMQHFSSGQNLIRTYKGCMVDNWTMSKTDNSAPISCTVDFVAKERVFGSIAPSLGEPTEATRRPYIPSDVCIHFPSGTKMDAKTWEVSIANNIDRDGAHVCNGSREISIPTPTEREYSLSFTIDGQSAEAARLYGIYESGGQIESNAGVEILNFGGTSGTSWISFSGCDIDEFNAPNPVEGIDEWELTLIPKDCAATIQDQTLLYQSW